MNEALAVWLIVYGFIALVMFAICAGRAIFLWNSDRQDDAEERTAFARYAFGAPLWPLMLVLLFYTGLTGLVRMAFGKAPGR